MRTGHESINQSQPCWALPHQAKGSNTEIRSSAHEQDVSTLTGTKKGYKSGNTNEDTATVASPPWAWSERFESGHDHSPFLSRVIFPQLGSLEFPVRSPVPAQLKFPILFRVMQGSGAWRSGTRASGSFNHCRLWYLCSSVVSDLQSHCQQMLVQISSN